MRAVLSARELEDAHDAVGAEGGEVVQLVHRHDGQRRVVGGGEGGVVGDALFVGAVGRPTPFATATSAPPRVNVMTGSMRPSPKGWESPSSQKTVPPST